MIKSCHFAVCDLCGKKGPAKACPVQAWWAAYQVGWRRVELSPVARSERCAACLLKKAEKEQ